MQRAYLHTQLVDGIQGLADVLAFGRGPAHLRQIRATGRNYSSSQEHLTQISSFVSGLSIFLTNFALWLILLIIIPRITTGQLNGSLLASFALLSLASFEAVTPLPLATQMWNSSREAARRLFEVVDTEPAVPEFEGNDIKSQTRVQTNPRSVDSRLKISDLTFTYPGCDSPALQHVTFDLDQGRSLGIVGPSGAGKSTLVNLLLRFWNYSSGEIFFGGQSLRSCSPGEVRERIALISQNTYFFNTSIYENLRMARRGILKEEIEAAARKAQIHDFILSLPKAYDTIVGEQGLRLSGGERQRLAIARAILKDSPILILDEPTANLDPLTEKLVLEALFDLMKEKTSLLITHRLVGLEKMVEILVLDQGCIVDRGTQSELLDHAGLYRRLFELQNRILVET